MHASTSCPPIPQALAGLDVDDGTALRAQALALKFNAREGQIEQRLRHKYFALVTEDQASEQADEFYSAATELGARVARIRPSVAGLEGARRLANTARWLGRLYDGVECQGLLAPRVNEIRRVAGIPVFDCLGCQRSGMFAMAGQFDEPRDRHYLLQAVLMGIFG